ncbi:MAG: acetylornithine deacetylase [Candidatus Endobugula sp.]|jgi:acetylornithine deacetylase
MIFDEKKFSEQLAQLVATPSVSCTNPKLDMGNRRVIDLLANWLGDMGFAIDIQVVDNNPDKANLIATLGSANAHKSQGGLVFSGHADTVPYDDKRWSHDPFTLHIDNERAYGLGATDMKGFFPTVLAAVQPFLGKTLREPIIILATADEETSMTGARELMHHPIPKARYGVVGEPTGMQPIRMHKGIGMESIKVRGQSGHSSNPALGNNALDVMHDVITELKQFRQLLQTRYQHAGFVIDVPTLNLGCIHGGDNPNRICGHCELAFDLRTLPGMSLDDLRADIDSMLNNIADRHHIDIERESLFEGIDAFEQTADSELVRAVERLTAMNADSVAFATEAPFLQKMGMDVVVMGPGSIDQAHQPDEYINLQQVPMAVTVLQGLITQFCV